MKSIEIEKLKSTALKVREHILRMSTGGGCFTGASLSCVDIIVYLYSKFLNINPQNLNNPDRDYFFLSKGHDVPALYGVFAELGFIEKDRLKNHLKTNDFIYWHPNRNIPGVEFHSGSLGHLLSVSIGVAIDCKMKNQNNRIVVLTGDGELNEGSIWEALLVASAYKLDNLLIIVDRNRFQANEMTEKLIPLEPLERKFESFGCISVSINGHSFEDIHEVLTRHPFVKELPSVVIADTIRGKGVPSIQERADRWFCNFSAEEVQSLIYELHNNQTAELTSPTLTVR
ncbi:MAG: transketolase [Ignavibacteriales bacterium]|nr:MAG: transketolase [Ignavibacteriales bacterium]